MSNIELIFLKFKIHTVFFIYLILSNIASLLIDKYVFKDRKKNILIFSNGLFGIIHYVIRLPLLTILFPMMKGNHMIYIIVSLVVVLLPIPNLIRQYKENRKDKYFYLSMILLVTALIAHFSIIYIFIVLGNAI